MADQWDEIAADLAPDQMVFGVLCDLSGIRTVTALKLRSAYEQGKRDEREECARVAERESARMRRLADEPVKHIFAPQYADMSRHSLALAAAIRSRSTNDA